MMIAEQRSLPAPERMPRHRHRPRHVDAHHAHVNLPREYARRAAVGCEKRYTVPQFVRVDECYAGNGAFEALGNIWETRRAAVFVPDLERGYGVCVSGPAEFFDGEVLQTEPFVRLSGAQRVLAIYPLYCQVQSWNDDLGPEAIERSSLFRGQ
jgi:hypothetical protein